LTALEALAPEDSAALLLFSDRLNLRVRPTRDRAAVRQPLERAVSQTRALTARWDATMAGASLLANESGRPVLMVVTDGCDNASWLSVDRAVQWLARSDVTVDYLYYGRGRRGPVLNWEGGDSCLGPTFLEKATEATGGRIFQTDHRDLTKLLQDRVKTLRSGYLLTYTPTGVKTGDGWHKIEVTLRKGVRGRVTTRPGYPSGAGS
jgi:VWFA-related protein